MSARGALWRDDVLAAGDMGCDSYFCPCHTGVHLRFMMADEDEGVEVVNCECLWTLGDSTWGDGERVDWPEHGSCPVHIKEKD